MRQELDWCLLTVIISATAKQWGDVNLPAMYSDHYLLQPVKKGQSNDIKVGDHKKLKTQQDYIVFLNVIGPASFVF